MTVALFDSNRENDMFAEQKTKLQIISSLHFVCAGLLAELQ